MRQHAVDSAIQGCCDAVWRECFHHCIREAVDYVKIISCTSIHRIAAYAARERVGEGVSEQDVGKGVSKSTGYRVAKDECLGVPRQRVAVHPGFDAVCAA